MVYNKAINKISLKAGVIIVWLLLWQLLADFIGSSFLFPPPTAVLKRLIELLQEGSFYLDAGSSLLRIIVGCFLGIALGTLLGALTSFSKLLYEFLSPVLTLMKSTPVASFIILLLIWVKRNNVPAVTSFIMVVPILWSNVSAGIAKTDKNLLEMAQIFRLSAAKKITKIYAPQVFAYFSAGCATAIGFAWKAGIAAEVLSIPIHAIGTNLYYAKTNLEYTDLFAWTAAVVALSLIFEKALVFAISSFTKKRGERYGY